jgi:glutamate transport system permease protein
MTAPVLGDELGPRGRRLVLVASIATTAVFGVLLVAAMRRLSTTGQLAWSKWELLTRFSVVRFLLVGLLNTMKAALVAMAGSIVLGSALALARLARTPIARALSRIYTEFFRGFPLLLLILFAFLGLPKLGLDLPKFAYLVLALVLYNGAVLGEIFRAGVLSLDRGQGEAAYTIGLTYWQAMGYVILPQALRRMIPAIVSQLVTLLKDTSLGFAVGYEELLRRGQITGEFGKNQLQSIVFVAVLYLIVNFTLSRVARRLEVRQRRRFKAGAIAVSGVEDLAAVQAHGDAAV